MRYKPEFQDIVFTVFLLLAMVRAEAAHVALVIGNSSYDATTGWWPLRNPGRDADAMSAVLRDALGFDRVLVYKDLDRRGLVDAIEAFDRALGEGDTAVFYYSGHGAYAGDGNYLVPTSARAPRSLRQLRNDSVALREITDVLATNKTALNVVVLDACRNNPLSRDKSFGGGSLRGTDRADFHGQTIIGYATAANRVAQDGDGQLSPYTAALSEVIADRHLNLWEVFGKVNVRVKEATHNSDHPQEPWKEDNFGYPPPYLAGTPPNPEGDRAREARDRAARHANAQAVRDRESRERSQDAARHSAAIEPEMVSIRGGRFWMGSPEGEDGRDNDERRHEVRVGDFRLGRTEVTQAQWRAVMGNNPSENQGCDRCPVERVSCTGYRRRWNGSMRAEGVALGNCTAGVIRSMRWRGTTTTAAARRTRWARSGPTDLVCTT